MYHSSMSTRDRDRIRQDILEEWVGKYIEYGQQIGFQTLIRKQKDD